MSARNAANHVNHIQFPFFHRVSPQSTTFQSYNSKVPFPPIDEQVSYIKKGLAELIREEDLRERLAECAKTGRPLRVKAGFDPTAPDLHLGHTVLLRKMKHFQDLGHTAIFVIGAGTALIGDPTGRNASRPPMTFAEVERNAETYKAQVFKVLDKARTEVRFNSDWLLKLDFQGMIRLAAKYTVARLLERDDFAKRFKENTPISVHELLYPLAQAYDSVALESDVELGGTDQKFNLLVGREIQRDYGQKPQIVGTTPLLEGLDGVNKMSKSLGNYVGIAEPPEEMFKKLMSISDDLMFRYYELLTDKSMAEIAQLRARVASGGLHPMEAKMELARLIITDFHSSADAARAASEFTRVVRRGEDPADMQSFSVAGAMRLDKLLAHTCLAASVSEAARKVKEGAVELNHERASAPQQMVTSGEHTLRLGRKFCRVVVA